jgi:hypothetical protein
VTFDQLCKDQALADVPQQDLVDSLKILEQKRLISISYVMDAPLAYVVLTDFGFQEFAEAYVPDYNDVVTQIAALLINENICQNEDLALRTKRPIAFINFVLNLMVANEHITVAKSLSGWKVLEISPSLKRALQQA